MKKVIIAPTPDDTVLIENVSSKKYYGTVINGDKGFISSEGYYDGPFFARCFSGLTHHNYWAFSTSPTLERCIEKIIRGGGGKVFEFDTWEELLRWALEK